MKKMWRSNGNSWKMVKKVKNVGKIEKRMKIYKIVTYNEKVERY